MDDGPSLADFIPGLNKTCEAIHRDHNYIVDLDMVWSSHLHRIGASVVKLVNLNTDEVKIHDDSGSMTWEEYEGNFLENTACTNFDIRPTGILRELFWETLRIDYAYWKAHGKHPIQGDIHKWAVETLGSHYFFSEFLSRMFGDPFDIREFEQAEEEASKAEQAGGDQPANANGIDS